MSSLFSPIVQNENINNENVNHSPNNLPFHRLNSNNHSNNGDALISPLSRSSLEDDIHFPESPDIRFLLLDRKSYIPIVPRPEIVAKAPLNNHSITSQMDPRSWLEVLDHKHRYSKNLRAYHREWHKLGEPKGDFFTWLDSTDHEIEECPRSVLETDTVYYCNHEEVSQYELIIDRGVFKHAQSKELVNTGNEGWIFVLCNDIIVAAEKKTSSPRFHHSSFFAGGCVEVAGILVIDQGQLLRLYPHSGHYRPKEEHVKYMLHYLKQHGCDLKSFDVDVQHVMKISRPVTRDGARIKKRECPHYLKADDILSFLTVKMRSDSLLRDISEMRNQAAAAD